MGWLQKVAGAVRNNVTAPLANTVEKGVSGLQGVVDKGITALPLNKQQATDAAVLAAIAAGGYYAYPYLTGAAGTTGAAGLDAAAAEAAGYSLAPGATTGAGMSSALGAGMAEAGGYSLAPTLTGAAGTAGTASALSGALSTGGQIMDWMNTAGQVAGLFSGVNQATGGSNIDPNAARNATDPFAPYRGKYAQQLDNLLTNPSSVTSLPGYEFVRDQGEQGVVRRLAAQGKTMSGNEMLALQEQNQGLANQMYNQEANRFATLSGGAFSPSAGGSAQLTAQQQNLDTQQAGANAASQSWGSIVNNPTVQNAAGKVWDYAFGS